MTARITAAAAGALFAAMYAAVVTCVNRPDLAEGAAVTALVSAGVFLAAWRRAFGRAAP